MPFCGLSSLFNSNRKNKRSLSNPTPVKIRARTFEDVETSRGAILSCDSASDTNIVSHRLVTKVLNEQIQPLDHASTGPIRTQTRGEEVGGYVDLDWRLESNTKQWHTSRFLVTTTYDPPYDAVLGRKDTEHYGMLRTRSRR